MDATKAMSILNRACPYLARTGLSALEGMAARGVSTSAVDQARCSVCPGHTGQSALLAKASECPVVGPSIRAKDAAAAAASASMAIPAACPYASCKPTVSENVSAAGTSAASASASAASAAEAVAVTAGPASHSSREAKFDYEGLYQSKLAKKHADKSYRYFNNINRLAMRYPQAHTANASNIVT
ncbi:mitochondrial 5-aminolevulinate synthase, partial [Coemansia sp. RSA 486]